jgi:hypothetical protein
VARLIAHQAVIGKSVIEIEEMFANPVDGGVNAAA